MVGHRREDDDGIRPAFCGLAACESVHMPFAIQTESGIICFHAYVVTRDWIYLYQALVKVKFAFTTPVAKVKVNLLPLPPLPVKAVKVKVVKVIW